MTAAGRPFWVSGQIVLSLDDGLPRRIDRPYALIGRTAGADLRIVDRQVSARHVYLHLNERGLFAIDLATRTGTRFDDEAVGSTWLAPGQGLEVAGHRVEVVAAHVNGQDLTGAAEDARPLTDTSETALPRLAMHPLPSTGGPWTLSSELVFLGRSPACGIRVRGSSAARVHAVLVRTTSTSYVVNLIGAGLWIDGRPVRDAAPLAAGALLTVGSSRFEVRQPGTGPPRVDHRPAVETVSDWPRIAATTTDPPTPSPAAARLPARSQRDPGPPGHDAPTPAEAPWSTELVLPAGVPPPPPELFEGESQGAVLAWMMGVVQATQSEMMRRQHDFQMELIRAIRGLHQDNQDALRQHEDRVEQIHRELAALREDIRQRFGGAAPQPAAPILPKGPPIKVPKPTTPPNDPATATAWLLNRVSRLDEDSRASWRDLLGRLGGTTPRPEP